MHHTPEDGEHASGDTLEPIDDPYVIGPLRSTVAARARVAPAPTARRAPRVRRATLVNVGLGLALVLSWGTGIALLVQRGLAPSVEPTAALPSPRGRVGSAAAPRVASAVAPRVAGVPRATTTIERGDITMVDVGVDARSLADELSRQRAAAQDAHETMLVMTTIAECVPCAAVFDALPEPLMQSTLARVRLVRVYAEVFKDDLDSLQIPREHFPGFFVLGPDLRPRDGIDGGEWDDDVAPNMAPVLDAFVRGTLSKRRTPWQALPGSGMRL